MRTSGAGDEVFVLDDLSTGSIDNIRHLRGHLRFHYTIESVHHAPTVAELVDQCDVVFHLAAAVGVRLIVESPVRTIETNVHGTEVVLAAGQQEEEEGPDRVDLRSLRALDRRPVSRGRQPGAGADLQGALELRLLEGDRRVPGPGLLARTEAADGHRPPVQHGRPAQTGQYGMVVPTFVKQALTGRPITIHGDGTQSRCFTDVSDVVGALVALMDHPAAVGEVFNIGSNEEVTDRGARRAGQGADRLALGDRLYPVRASLRRGLRGHAAAGSRHQQDRRH